MFGIKKKLEMIWFDLNWIKLNWIDFINQISCLEWIIKNRIWINLEINYCVWNSLKLKLIWFNFIILHLYPYYIISLSPLSLSPFLPPSFPFLLSLSQLTHTAQWTHSLTHTSPSLSLTHSFSLRIETKKNSCCFHRNESNEHVLTFAAMEIAQLSVRRRLTRPLRFCCGYSFWN